MDRMDTPPPTISQAAAVWIQEAMAAQNISVRGMATATRIPRVTLIRRFEDTPHNFTVGELEKIARVLGVKVSDIAEAAEQDAA